MPTFRLILALTAGLILPGACSSSTPMATPQVLATSWCQSHRPGDEACLATAEQAHRQCITAPGRYDDCRARLLGSSAAAR